VHSQTKELAISHECVGSNNSLNVLRDGEVNIMIINGRYFSSLAVTLQLQRSLYRFLHEYNRLHSWAGQTRMLIL
jgi:hypothetical protein